MTRWCWHRWTKWEDVVARHVSILFRREWEEPAQVRMCEKCGKRKIRSVED